MTSYNVVTLNKCSVTIQNISISIENVYSTFILCLLNVRLDTRTEFWVFKVIQQKTTVDDDDALLKVQIESLDRL